MSETNTIIEETTEENTTVETDVNEKTYKVMGKFNDRIGNYTRGVKVVIGSLLKDEDGDIWVDDTVLTY